MKINDLDTYRELRNVMPLFFTEYLPYIDTPLDDGKWGHKGDFFTTAAEAREAYDALVKSGHVEVARLFTMNYRVAGMMRTLLDEWKDSTARDE